MASAGHAGLAGAVYGAKIRGPHALVMALVFGRNKPFRQLVRDVLSATVTHSRQLGAYAALYTAMRAALVRALGEKRATLCAFAAGVSGGAVVWGDDTAINAQLNLYLLSRIVSGLVRSGLNQLGVRGGARGFRLWSAAMWGAIMVMYESRSLHPHMQASLLSSMRYIYSPPHDGVRRVERRDMAWTAAAWLAFAALTRAGAQGGRLSAPRTSN
ncbi:hypothetical protein KFE25_003496 [Diacronema lutheri]|uniref:Peroxisomal membrane protein 4 n=2 Tax=Diacronema lutheri TaxID=2081491 RepID=A0A8J5XD06_DIALT|nr:hypothetical protein KFE25_003496 [Diacronema lutheri]